MVFLKDQVVQGQLAVSGLDSPLLLVLSGCGGGGSVEAQQASLLPS